jgi:hypothetical protein
MQSLQVVALQRSSKEPDSPLLELASVAHRLPKAVFSGRTAGWLHGLDFSPTDPVEVIISDGHASGRAGVRLRRAKLAPEAVVRLKGLPVTSGLRTAIDLGCRGSLVDAVAALDMALYQRLVSVGELQSFLESNAGAKGIARLRRAVDLAEPAAE